MFLHNPDLMRDPILQEKRQEHVLFQKYAIELLELLSGKGKHTDTNLEASLADIHRVSLDRPYENDLFLNVYNFRRA